MLKHRLHLEADVHIGHKPPPFCLRLGDPSLPVFGTALWKTPCVLRLQAPLSSLLLNVHFTSTITFFTLLLKKLC